MIIDFDFIMPKKFKNMDLKNFILLREQLDAVAIHTSNHKEGRIFFLFGVAAVHVLLPAITHTL